MRKLRLGFAGLLIGLVGPAAAFSAATDNFDSAATTCDQQVYEQPFLRWGDPAQYVLTPGGTFDSATNWLLNGAAIVDGSEPYGISGSLGDNKSLLLGSGASATSPPICVTLLHPTLRLVGRSGGLGATLRVEVLYKDIFGQLQSLEVGRLKATSSWAPTVPLLFLTNVLSPLSQGGRTAVAFRFTAVGGSWQIDDVYVDPFKDR